MRLISLPPAKYLLLLAMLAGMCLAISGCGPNITVNMADPLENALETETKQLTNCNNKNEMVSVLEVQSNYKIDDYATTGSQGKRVLVLPETKAELEAQLEMAYAPIYETAKASVGQIELIAPADMIRAYKIEWTQHIYHSTITFRDGFKKYSATYTYELRIPKESTYTEYICYP